MKFLTKNGVYIVLFFLTFLLVLAHIFAVSFEPNDELWNFQNVYKIYNNYIIYSDANVIITPLFYVLGVYFLKFFGATIISFRIFNIFIFGLYFLILFYIFKSLKFSKHINILSLSLIFLQILPVINGGANYNALCNVFILFGILCYIKFYEKKHFNFIQGFIIFLIFFTKQNLGVYYACSIIIFEFIYKKSFINFLSCQIKKLISFFIPSSVVLYIFYKKNILTNFINYAFGGISDFGTSNVIFSASPYIVLILGIIVFLYFYILFNKKIFHEGIVSEQRRRNLHLIGIISIGISFSVFPIANTAHFMYVLTFYLMLLLYFLDFTFLEDVFNTEKIINLTYIITIFILLLILIRILFSCFIENNSYITVNDATNPFYRTRITNENFEKITVMSDYIKNKTDKKVIIIAYDSALTMVPLNQNNQSFDLVFNGNLGYDGENKLIEKIKNSENTEFLIYTNEDDCFWQESKKIRNFIIDNLEKTGEILNYSIYELK